MAFESEQIFTYWALMPLVEEGRVIPRPPFWKGHYHTAPDADRLRQMFLVWKAESIALGNYEQYVDALLASWTVEILRNAPPHSLHILLSVLATSFWDEGNHLSLFSLVQTRQRRVCGKVFRRGDIVWTCKTCAKDQTCVQCNTCFNNSDHTDHEVYFHRAGGNGGCCDCGDPEAWHIAGNCHQHGDGCMQGDDNESVDCDDPVAAVPCGVQRGITVVTKAAVGFLVSYISSSVRAFQRLSPDQHPLADPCPTNPYCYPPSDDGRESEDFSLYLHNDDIHSFDDVISALAQAGANSTTASALTHAVDSDGQACFKRCKITSQNHEAEFRAMSSTVDLFAQQHNLLCSFAPTRLFVLEGQIHSLMSWMVSLGKSHEGLERLVSLVLVAPLSTLPEVVCRNGTGYASSDKLFCEPMQGDDDTTILPPFPGFITPLAHIRENRETAVECLSTPLRISKEGYVEPWRMFCPLQHCPGLQVPLAVLILSSPLLFKSLKLQINALVIIYQQDPIFKAAFSQLFTCLYPGLHALKMAGIGTAVEEIFITSVQIYTANGVVTTMSSDGVPYRYLDESSTMANVEPVTLTKMLIDTARNALVSIGCSPPSIESAAEHHGTASDESFLDHSHLSNRRLATIFRDFEYVTENSLGNIRVMSGRRDAGTVDALMGLCSMLQCLDSARRRTDIHIEIESLRWASAANLVLIVESASTNLVTNALFPSAEIIESEKQCSSIDLAWAGVAGTKKCDQMQIAAADSGNLTSITDASSLNAEQQEAFLASFNIVIAALRKWGHAKSLEIDHSDLYFYATGQIPIHLLGQVVPFPAPFLRAYTVSHKAISLHIPLHRMLSKLVYFAACRGLSLSACLEAMSQCPEAVICLVDYTLRTMAFVAQANNGSWVRNGVAPINLAYNYLRPPLCKVLRDVDLVSIQLGIAALGPDVMLCMMVDRFELSLNFDASEPIFGRGLVEVPGVEASATLGYIAELLKLLAHVVVVLPTILHEDASASNSAHQPPSKALQHALSVAVVNHVLAGSNTLHALDQIRALIGNSKAIQEATLLNAVHAHTTRRETSDGVGAVFELLPESYQYFDPLYMHLNDKHSFSSKEAARLKVERSLQQGGLVAEWDPSQGVHGPGRYRALVSRSMLLEPHPQLKAIRAMLLHSRLFTAIIKRTLAICLDPGVVSSSPGAVDKVLESIVYLLTIYCILDDDNDDSATPHTPPSLDHELFNLLCQVHSMGAFARDPLFTQGMLWLLCRLDVIGGRQNLPGWVGLRERGLQSLLLPVVEQADAIVTDVCSASTASSATSSSQLLTDRKLAAQNRIKAAMARQAASFMSTLNSSDDEDSCQTTAENSVATSKMQESTTFTPLHQDSACPECIICHSPGGLDQPCGFLAMVTPSTLLSSTIGQSIESDHPGLARVYRVTALTGLDILAPAPSGGPMKETVILHVPQGTHVLAAPEPNRYDTLLLIEAPVRGFAMIYEPNPSHRRGSIQTSTRSRSDIKVNLVPLTRLLWSQHGPGRGYITRCGHAMHTSCYREYIKSRVLCAQNPAMSLPHCCDISRGEMLCPLCKAIGNTLIPVVLPDLSRRLIPRGPIEIKSEKASTACNQAAISPFFSLPAHTSRHAVVAHINALFTSPTPTTYVPVPTELIPDTHAIQETISGLGKLPWMSELHTRACSAVMNYPDMRGYPIGKRLHAVYATVGHTIMISTMVRRWVGWTAHEQEQWGAHAVDSKSPEERLSLPLGAQMVLLLRSVPRTLPDGMDFETLITSPLQQLLCGELPAALESIVNIRNRQQQQNTGNGLGAIDIPCGEVVDIKTLSPPGAVRDSLYFFQRLALTMPYESLPSGFLPDHRRHSFQAALCMEHGVPSEESWGALMVPLLSQDLVQVAAASVSAAASLEVIKELFGLLVWARVCQALVEPPPATLLQSSQSGSSTGWSSAAEEEGALLTLQNILLNNNLPTAAVREYRSAGGSWSRVVCDAIAPFAEFLVLLLRAVECASLGGDANAMKFVLEQNGPLPLAPSSNTSPVLSSLESVSLLLTALHCPSLRTMLLGEPSSLLKDLAQFWARQYWIKIELCTGKIQNHEVNWIPQHEERDASSFALFEPPTGALTVSRLATLDDPLLEPGDGRRHGTWTLAGEDPEYYFVDEPNPTPNAHSESSSSPLPSLDISTLRATLLALHSTTPLLGSVTGMACVYGVGGTLGLSNETWPDFSHMGMGNRHACPLSLFRLPKCYTDLYYRCKFPYGLSPSDSAAEQTRLIDDGLTAAPNSASINREPYSLQEPAYCLACGRVVNAGNRVHDTVASISNPGECTLHARYCGFGSGAFFLLQKHAVLLISSEKAAFWASLYLDSNGESGVDGACKPLTLETGRVRRLAEMMLRGELGREVARIRSSSDKVVRNYYY